MANGYPLQVRFTADQIQMLKAQSMYECRSLSSIIRSAALQYVCAHKHIIKDKIIYNPFVPQRNE